MLWFSRSLWSKSSWRGLMRQLAPPSTAFGLIRACNGAPLSPPCGARRLEDDLLQVAATHDDDREIQPAAFADQAAADGLARRRLLGDANGICQAVPDRLECNEVAAVLGIELASGAGRLRRRRSCQSWRRWRAARCGRCEGSLPGRPATSGAPSKLTSAVVAPACTGFGDGHRLAQRDAEPRKSAISRLTACWSDAAPSPASSRSEAGSLGRRRVGVDRRREDDRHQDDRKQLSPTSRRTHVCSLILEACLCRRSGPDRIVKKSRPTPWRHMGRPRNVANGAVPPFAAIEAARAPLGLVKAGSALRSITKPYRIVLFWSTTRRVSRRRNAVLTELSAGGAPPNGALWRWTGRGSVARARRPGTA